MCGIAGIIRKEPNSLSQADVKALTDAIAHRGPDGEGQWVNDNGHLGLGHRRLSILDLSIDGAQPMHYGERYTIVFNGEIYNYLELREGLVKKGYAFKSTSDTEVLMALYADKGTSCLQMLDGMFSFALYDAATQNLFIARDRFGEKPFFYGFNSRGDLLFGSEMKALWAGGLPKVVNQQMLYRYLSAGRVENETDKAETFYSNIRRLPAAHFALVNIHDIKINPVRYWNIDPAIRNNDITPEEAAAHFHELFYTSVSRRLRSDVPVGSSLSGGFDSSLVVCAIDGLDKERNIVRKTFSAQFPGFEKDESKYQRMVIDRCHVDPHFIEPTAESMLKNLDRVMYHQEEPFGSASICVQYEVFGLAKENGVTVLMDGQGADEILAGYHSYYKPYFTGLKAEMNSAVYNNEHSAYNALQADNTINLQHRKSWRDAVKRIVPERIQQRVLHSRRQAYSGEAILHPAFKAANEAYEVMPEKYPDLQAALFHDTTISGLEILLRFADRNSMAHSREVRLPFLYHEMVEFIFTLPDTMKIHEGWTKWIMRKAFEETVPKEIVWRKDKIGYEPPQQKWFREPGMQKVVKEAAEALADHHILSSNAAVMSDTMQWKVFTAGHMLY